MKKIANVFSFLIILVISFTICAQTNVAVAPTMGKTAAERKLAKEIDDNLSLLLSSIKDADLAAVSSGQTARCKADSKCVARVILKSKPSDYVIVVKVAKNAKTDEIKTSIMLYDKSIRRVGGKSVTSSSDSDGEDIAADMISAIKSLVASNISKKSNAVASSSSPSSSKSKRLASYTEVKEEIKKGFAAYDKGNIDEASEIFDVSANEMNCKCSQNDVAKRLLNSVKKIKNGLPKAASAVDSGDYKIALKTLDEVKKADDFIREQGYKYMVFKKDKNVRKRYLEPNPKDAMVVDQIHKRFKAKIEDVRKWRAKQLAKIDSTVNVNIKAREKKIADLKSKEKEIAKDQKKTKADLTKKIQNMKYQWEKDDSGLEQEIVNLESQITQIEQREKGVIKISNKKREEAKERDFKAHDVAYDKWKTALQKEKDAYYEKQKKLETTEGEQITKKVKELEKKKGALEAKNRELDAEIQKMRDAFDAEERKIMSANEAIRMGNEDEDRKYNVQVEKEYQKKFDSLNQNLAKYDDQDSAKAKELEKYDRETEDFMMKSAASMGAIQENIEKERAKIEAEYAKVKDDAQAKAEKDYETLLNKLAADKAKLEEAAAKHTEETEVLKAKKEEEMIKNNEIELNTAEQKILANENAISKIEQEYEEKFAKLQDVTARTLEDEENEKIKKENEIRAINDKSLAEVASLEEKIATETGKFEELKARIVDDYSNKIAAIDEKIMVEQNKLVEASENFKAGWGDVVNKEIDKLTARDNKIRSEIDAENAKIAEIDGKFEQQKMEELNKLEAKLDSIEENYSRKTVQVEEEIQKEIEAAKAETLKEIERSAAEDAKEEEAFGKKMEAFASEEVAIAASFDQKAAKYNEQIDSIDKKYEQKAAPYNIDSIMDKMNQSVAELENAKVEAVNKLQELLDAIDQAKSSAEQTYNDDKENAKNNKAELAKLEREHAALVRKMDLDVSSTQRKIKFEEDKFERSIKFEKSKYEREIAKNKKELSKLEKEKNLELISIKKDLNKLDKEKDSALAAHKKKSDAANSAHKSKMNSRIANAKKITASGNAKEKKIAGSVKARKAAIEAQKSNEIKQIKSQKANINAKYKELSNKEKATVKSSIANKQKELKEIAVSIKNWEKKSNVVDPAKLKEIKSPYEKNIANFNKEKKELQKEKANKINMVVSGNKKVISDLTANKNQALNKTKGVDATIKKEFALISNKYNDVRAKIKADTAKLQAEKKQKIAVLKTENNANIKKKTLAEKGFKKALAKEISKLAGARNSELAKLKAELAQTSKALAIHEKSHDKFVQKAVGKIDQKYEKELAALDTKLMAESQKLQKENEAFAKKKKGEKAAATKQYKLFLAEKKKFKASIDQQILTAQKERDRKIEARKTERNKQQEKWNRERDKRSSDFDRKTSSSKTRFDNNNKQIDALTGEIENVNNVWARKLEELKSKHHAAGKKQEIAWNKSSEAKAKWYENGKKAIADKYDNMEIKEKENREKQKLQMMAKRERLLGEKDKRKDKRQATLDKEKEKWEKSEANFISQLDKLKNEIENLNSQKSASAEKDKDAAKAKKEQVAKQYQQSLDKINVAELKQVAQKFKAEYKEESVREVQITEITKKIESAVAEAHAKAGLDKLSKNDVSLARKDFVEALYMDGNNETAKEGLKAISTKAQAMYWEAFGIKESNKTKAIRILETLMKSLLPIDEFYLKSMLLLEELK